MRGEVPEEAITDELLRRRQLGKEPDNAGPASTRRQTRRDEVSGGAPEPYVPASEGALAEETDQDDETAQSLFSDAVQDEVSGLSQPLPPTGTKAPSTARRRAEEARERRSPPSGETATDRRRPSETTAETATEVDDETTAGIEAVGTVDSETETELELDEGAERAEAIEGLDSNPEDDPYAPLGLRLGSFNVYSSLEQGLTATSNVNSTQDADAAILSETTLRLRAESDWSRHTASVEAYGTLRSSIDGPEVDDDEAGVLASTRIDINNELRALGTLRYQIRPESASSPVVIEGAVSRPVRQSFEGTAGIAKDMGKLRLSATGGLVYDAFGDARLDNGTILSQEDRNSLLGTVKLRAGYEISPALTPFVEVEVGRRKYDVEVDATGFERSSDRLGARGGVALDLGEKLRGEVAAGWLRETPDDERLDEISGATLDANLVWSPVRGTNVTLFGATTVEGTTTPGETGSLLYTTRLNIDREIRANLTGNLLLGAALRDYVGSNGREVTLAAEAGLTWWMNRYLGLTGRARHEEVHSNLEGRDTKTDSVFVGVKLQR